jgi:ABC-type oligopeptide transport system ATPase subunit
MTLVCTSLAKSFGGVTVLDDVSITVAPGESVGLVGESGSGKSTFVRCAVLLSQPDAGAVIYDGIDMLAADRAARARFRREVQLVFQDPYSSLNPRMTVEELVGEGLLVHGIAPDRRVRRDRVAEMLDMVGLNPADMGRYPRAFSGGQRQRIAIARALAIRPRILVCDEPVSALDVSVQAQVINLLQDMQQQMGLGILFVAHDLAVVRHLCAEVVVLHQGRVAERGSREDIFEHARHPYTRSLLDAVPIPDPAAARRLRAERRQQPDSRLKEERHAHRL